jgi:ADP-heptose:LPS heptosyltransferase
MLDGLRRSVGLTYSRLHFRDSHDRVMHFTDILTRSHRALVIFPETSLDGESTSNLFRFLLKKFPPEKVTVLIPDSQLFAMSSVPPLKTLTYSADDVNTWFVPRRKLLKKMGAKSYDVAFDLNIDLSLTSAFLCKATNAPLRVSFVKQNGDQFYNFQIKTKDSTSQVRSYRNLLKCLDMF